MQRWNGVQVRSLKWRNSTIAMTLLDIALDNLSLGRAQLLQSQHRIETNSLTADALHLSSTARWMACGRQERNNYNVHAAYWRGRSIIGLRAIWIRRVRIWMKPSRLPRAGGWGCIWRIVIWSMRGWRWQGARKKKPASIGKPRRIVLRRWVITGGIRRWRSWRNN